MIQLAVFVTPIPLIATLIALAMFQFRLICSSIFALHFLILTLNSITLVIKLLTLLFLLL